MEFWTNVLIVVHVLVALSIIGLVLLQHGKGADMGSGFGGGASGSLFGATGSANFLSRMTAVLATLFFVFSLGLGYLATNRPKATGGVMESVKEQPAVPQPAADAGKAPTGAPVEPSKSKDVPN